MLHKTESRKAELKIRRMEYRAAHLPVSEPMLKLNASVGDALAYEASAEKMQAVLREQQQRERIQELEQQLAERESLLVHKLEAVRKEAFEQGYQEAGSVHATTVQQIRDALGESLQEFYDARDTYLAQVEQEVVRLSLGIATRILHREAQMDPLLLSGAVRVALGQLADTTEVRLRIPADEFELWSEMVRLMPSLPLRPQLVADTLLGPAECTLETHLGSVDLGVKAQLAEIERGFFDLLEHRGAERRNEALSASERREA